MIGTGVIDDSKPGVEELMSRNQRAVAARGSFVAERLEPRTFLNAGDLDKSFSGDGKTTVAGGAVVLDAGDVAVQADGKTVIVGSAPSATSRNSHKVAV